MDCSEIARARQCLEAAYQHSPSIPFHRRFMEFLQQIGAAIFYELTRDSHEPRISKYYDIQGRIFWHVYDPVEKISFTTHSELQLNEWLNRTSDQSQTKNDVSS